MRKLVSYRWWWNNICFMSIFSMIMVSSAQKPLLSLSTLTKWVISEGKSSIHVLLLFLFQYCLECRSSMLNLVCVEFGRPFYYWLRLSTQFSVPCDGCILNLELNLSLGLQICIKVTGWHFRIFMDILHLSFTSVNNERNILLYYLITNAK